MSVESYFVMTRRHQVHTQASACCEVHTVVTLVTYSEFNSHEIRTQDATMQNGYFEGKSPCCPDNSHDYLYPVS
jgi:hypothetical protein